MSNPKLKKKNRVMYKVKRFSAKSKWLEGKEELKVDVRI